MHIRANNYSVETAYNYERDLMILSQYLENAHISFSEVNKQTIEQFKGYLHSEGRITAGGAMSEGSLSASSINRLLTALRRYLTYLIDMDHVVPITPSTIKFLRNGRRVTPIINLKEIQRLIESPTKLEVSDLVAKRNRAALETLFASGMRISELVSLKRNQVDANAGKIFIEGKGKKQRFVYLTDRARLLIKSYLDVRNDENPFLFATQRDAAEHLSTNYLQVKIKRYREALGIITPISAHSLRHSFATAMAEGGASPAAIQILLGHESLDTTTRYVHASDRFAEDTHKKFHPLNK